MSEGLSVSRLVKVDIVLSPLAPARRGFGILLVLGDSDVISVAERLRSFGSIEGVANAFGINAPEYKAAQLYFGQSPKPSTLIIGRWARVATAALLKGAILSSAEQAIASWQAITDGSFEITIDGNVVTATALDFSAALNLNNVASLITAKLGSAGTCTFDGQRFQIVSATTGATSTISYAEATGSGTDISAKLKLTSSTALAPVNGVDSETLSEAVVKLANKSNEWYGLSIASSVRPSNSDLTTVAVLVQALSTSRIFGVTEIDSRVLDAEYTDDLASEFKELGLTRSFVQYSQNENAINSFFGRAFSVNFNANRSVITMMFKQEPGVNAENLEDSQADTLAIKRCNVFVKYDNDTSIIQNGVMSGPAWFDEIHGLDWFQNAVQNAVYTLLYTSGTKIPQTNEGSNLIVNAINAVCEEAVNNGLVAPGVWNQDGFGQIQRGSYLKTGYYVYVQPIELQSQADREARKAPPIQIAIKLAGAIHSVDVIVNVNR